MVNIPSGLGLAKLTAEFRVQPMLSFYEHLVPLGMQFEDKFEHWTTDRMGIRFIDAKSRIAVSIKHNQLLFEADLPADTQTFVSHIRPIMRAYMNLPHVKKVHRVGLRGQYFVTKGFTFEELVTILEESLLIPAPRRQHVLPGKMSDLMFNVVLESGSHMIHVIVGPVRRMELGRWTQAITYDVGEHPESIEYPDVSVLLDIDVYSDKIGQPSEAMDFATTGAKVIADTASGLNAYLFPER